MENKGGEQRHIRLAHFLANGCTTLARAIVEKHVELSKPPDHKPDDKPWSLDSFLYENMKKLSKGSRPEQQKMLFPFQKETEIQKWDLALHCYVIITCTENHMVKHDMLRLKNIRNQIYHAGVTEDFTQEKYDVNVKSLDCIVERCCEFIDKHIFSETMKELLENFKRGNVLVTDKDYETIRQWYEKDPVTMLHSKVDQLSDDHQLLISKIEELLVLTKQNELKGIVLPDTNVELIVKNCDSTKEKVISEYLVKLLKCRMAKDIPDIPEANKQKIFDLIRESMTELLAGGREVVDIYQACVNLTIRCATFESLRDLWIDCMTGKLTGTFKPLETYVRQLTGCPDITIEVGIAQFEFNRCLEATVMQIVNAIQSENDDVFGEKTDLFTEITSAFVDDIDADSSRHSPDEVAINQAEGGGNRVVIRIQPTSFNQAEHMWEACQSGSFNDKLEKVSQVFQEAYGYTDLRITAKTESASPYEDIFRNRKRKLPNTEDDCIEKETVKVEKQPELQMTDKTIEEPMKGQDKGTFDQPKQDQPTAPEGQIDQEMTSLDQPMDDPTTSGRQTDQEKGTFGQPKKYQSTTSERQDTIQGIMRSPRTGPDKLEKKRNERELSHYTFKGEKLPKWQMTDQTIKEPKKTIQGIMRSPRTGPDKLEKKRNERELPEYTFKVEMSAMDTEAEGISMPDQNEDRDEHIYRIVKLMDQVSENLEEDDLANFVSIIKKAKNDSSQIDETQLKNVVVDFTKLTMFKRGISVDLLKQAVRSLIEMHQDVKLWESVWNNVAGKYNLSILAEFGELDPETLRKYQDALKSGKENVRHIRLMVVGMFGVGKTTIIRRLCKKDAANVKSTVGIDIYGNACEVYDNGEWRVTDLKKKKEDVDYIKRIMDCIKRNKQAEKQPIAKKKQIPTPTDFQKAAPKRPVDVPNRQTGPFEEGTELRPKENEVIEWHEETTPSEPIPEERFRERLKKDKHKKFAEGLKDAMVEVEHVKPEKRETTVSIWDFAGQSIYYSTHQFFLSSRAIYLLVLDISKELSDPVPEDELCGDDSENRATSMPKGFTCLDAFKFWMNSIYIYTSAKYGSSNAYRPTIVLVGTFKDKVNVPNKDRYMESYFKKALESLQNSEVLDLVYEKKFFVSKDDKGEIFDDLKSELTNIAKQQVFWNESVPIKWMSLERSIEVRKGNPFQTETGGTDDENAILKLEELEKIDKETEYPLDDKDQLKLFLKFQHARGNVVYYDADGLDNSIILEPQWILDVFKLFVAHARNTKPSLTKEWVNYEQNAILSVKLISELIKQNPKFQSFQENDITRYMEHLDVIAEPIWYTEQKRSFPNGDDFSKPDNKEEKFYIVPCLLSLKPPTENLKCMEKSDDKSTPVLCLVFKNDFLPAFVCHRLMATCIRLWEVRQFKTKAGEQKLMLFNGMGVFWLNPYRTSWLKLWWEGHIIYMQIFLRSSDKMKQLDGENCSEVRTKIERMIQRIFSIHLKRTADVTMNETGHYEKYIKCPKYENDPIDDAGCMIPVESFSGEAEAGCGEGHIMSRDAALSKWFFKDNERQNLEDMYKIRGSLFKWMKKNTDESVEMDVQDFADLSNWIGKEYKVLGIALGLPFTRIEHIQNDKSVKTSIKDMLLEWKKTAKEPTVGAMKNAIMNVLGVYYKDGNFLKESFDRKKVVEWFDSKMAHGNQMTTPSSDAQPIADVEHLSEQDLLMVTHFVEEKYKKLAGYLFKEDIYVKIEQIEEDYKLDVMRVLAVLLQWKKENLNASIVHLKEAIEKLLNINFDSVREEMRNESLGDGTKVNDQVLQPDGTFESIRERTISDETLYKRHGGASAERVGIGEVVCNEAEFDNEEEQEVLQSDGTFKSIRGRTISDKKRLEEVLYNRRGGASAKRVGIGEGVFSEAGSESEEQ